MFLCHLQPWYDLLESMHHALPDEDARDKFAGESWAMRLTRLADRQLEVGRDAWVRLSCVPRLQI